MMPKAITEKIEMLATIHRLLASDSKPYIPTPQKKLSTNLGFANFQVVTPKHGISDLKACNIKSIDLLRHEPSEEQKAFGELLIKMAWPIKSSIFLSHNAGMMTMSCKAFWIKKNNSTDNCFKKDFFENHLLSQTYFLYGPGSASDRTYQSPIHWRPIIIGETEWIYFESHETESYPHSPLLYCHFFTPINSLAYLRINFEIIDGTKSRNGTLGMKNLMKNIMLGSSLHLSPTSREEKFFAEQQWPSIQYSPQRSPEKWDYPKGDRSEMTAEDRIAKSKTPPPKLYQQQ